MNTPESEISEKFQHTHKSLSMSGMNPIDMKDIPWKENTPLRVNLFDRQQIASGYLAGPPRRGEPLQLKRGVDDTSTSSFVTVMQEPEFAFLHENGDIVIGDRQDEYCICTVIDAESVESSTLDDVALPKSAPESINPLDMNPIDLFQQDENTFTRLTITAAQEAIELLNTYEIGALPGDIETLISPTLEWATRNRGDTLQNPVPNAILNQFRANEPVLSREQSYALEVIAATRLYKKDAREVEQQRGENRRKSVERQGSESRGLFGKLFRWGR
jgi:hypothetical protein